MRHRFTIALLAAICTTPVAAAAPALQPTALGAAPAGIAADGVRVLAPVAVWPKGAPEEAGWPGKAAVSVREEVRENGNLFNVTVPSYQAFLPPPGKATGAAVILAPGGGFRLLAMKTEGVDVAQWLAAHGVAAFVLKYRLIQTPPGETNEAMRKRVNATLAPGVGGNPGVVDGLEALRTIRGRASEYGIDPKRIGVAGFSAGGHVAGMMALAPNIADRPAFAGLIYGMPFTAPLPAIPPANLPFPPGTPKEPWLQPTATPAPERLPPLFMAQAQDDVVVGMGFRTFYEALYAAGYRPEVHLYQRGGHGFGARFIGGTTDHWLDEFVWWLDGEGMTKPRRER
ncbi:alpha/beta hydrolase [Novosphingobium sp. Leaf2]|uniref:alpha/beta hydrolase n=1 Tax=Novosphingobium sp. Leaf2 TaxID=1735670 RepID=UPI0006F4F355|nr:alpha/beta hydrolase [Novosphingobium sp. Leaf2]KQM19027.1 esterase [Novosphingobium sp. Leaf2]